MAGAAPPSSLFLAPPLSFRGAAPPPPAPPLLARRPAPAPPLSFPAPLSPPAAPTPSSARVRPARPPLPCRARPSCLRLPLVAPPRAPPGFRGRPLSLPAPPPRRRRLLVSPRARPRFPRRRLLPRPVPPLPCPLACFLTPHLLPAPPSTRAARLQRSPTSLLCLQPAGPAKPLAGPSPSPAPLLRTWLRVVDVVLLPPLLVCFAVPLPKTLVCAAKTDEPRRWSLERLRPRRLNAYFAATTTSPT
ncbi:hypothetical protein BRADI_3g27933v3 [Brachypodium distachyon]|uniref:Uncharacterized protein n=1 Tax=Brachypodium distachyon TaxID=15368 RepID=A0A0Q3I9C1_BRADI|nr:hypothetical protein BRADI_3g27933v3 [Brachypodium distachyon]